MVKKFAEKEHQ